MVRVRSLSFCPSPSPMASTGRVERWSESPEGPSRSFWGSSQGREALRDVSEPDGLAPRAGTRTGTNVRT